ncbi:amidoligase family protein [Hungatella hathewayi]
MDMKMQKFGLELEFTGITREEAALVIGEYWGSKPRKYNGNHDSYRIMDSSNRKWRVVYDGSIVPECRYDYATEDYQAEMVTPICQYDDIPVIQELVRRLRRKGAVAGQKCGIHIHVDAAPYDARTLRNITNIMASKEDLIYKALQVQVERKNQYCQPVNALFLEELNRKKPKTTEGVKTIWYRGGDKSRSHYDKSRYHCLNLHSVFEKGTIEFRLFNSTMDDGEVKAYIHLCLAISHQALTQSSASRRVTVSTNEKYTFRTWLLRLGLNGEEFSETRKYLLKHLDGCIAWKDPEQAVQQKLRRERNGRQTAQEEQREVNREAAGEENPGFFMSM